MRMSHECPTDKSKNTLVTVFSNSGKRIEAKCLDINQLRTEQLAVGANDQYVRLYDRRMIQSLSSLDVKCPSFVSEYEANNANKVNNALQYFVPGHIHSNDDNGTITPKRLKNYVITYLTFSPDGQELLANYGGEYVYLYNLVNRSDNAFFNISKVMKVPRKFLNTIIKFICYLIICVILGENGEGSSTDLIDDQVPVPHLTLPDKVVQLKLKVRNIHCKLHVIYLC